MRLSWKGPEAAVYDDWLPPDSFSALQRFLQAYRYFSVLTTGKRGPLGTIPELSASLRDGSLRLLGGPFVVDQAGAPPDKGKIPYPSGTPLDTVLDAVRAAARELPDLLGREGADWQRLGAGPRLYPKDRGLDWHDDARFVGTFALYAHAAWEEAWGGELALGSPEGRRFAPLPNRCVFLKAGVPHTVRPVAAAAGDRLRMSVIGYTSRAR